MKKIQQTILAIETSCDETAVSVLNCCYENESITTEVRAQSLFSQADIHAVYGGVFPNIAKREHAVRIIPLIIETLTKAFPDINAIKEPAGIDSEQKTTLEQILQKEPAVYEAINSNLEVLRNKISPIDTIVVTQGPGLEPALWVGINTARALGALFTIPVIGAHHMEGHLLSPFIGKTLSISTKKSEQSKNIFPALGLMISGGHTDIVHATHLGNYILAGTTRDDAVGEAFDKAARVIGLPYPGGPKVSFIASRGRSYGIDAKTYGITLPRPMINDASLDFSFSGLKTAVLYTVRDLNNSDSASYKDIGEKLYEKMSLSNDQALDINTLTEVEKKIIALCIEFEDSVANVLGSKIEKAITTHNPRSLILGGGVAANTYIKKHLEHIGLRQGVTVYSPQVYDATDNASMIGIAGFARIINIVAGADNKQDLTHTLKTYSDRHILKANGNAGYTSNMHPDGSK